VVYWRRGSEGSAEAAAGEVGGACGVFGEMPTRMKRAQVESCGEKFGSAANGRPGQG
jgi:hypothetical protein